LERKEVEISTDSIQLDKFLKWAAVAETGGEAKLLVQEGLVKVNGVVEKRRSRSLKAGDVVEYGGLKLVVKHDG